MCILNNLFLLADGDAASATGGGLGGGSGWIMLVWFAVIILVMYFVMIRPQKKKQKKEEQMRNNLQVGDEIITIAGTYGRVVAVKEDSLVIESGPDRSKMKIARWAINQNLTVHDDTPEKK